MKKLPRSEEIQAQVDKRHYHAAINIALSCINECVRTGDTAGAHAYLTVMKTIVHSLEQSIDDPSYTA